MWNTFISEHIPLFLSVRIRNISYVITVLIIAFVIFSMKRLLSVRNERRTEDVYFLRICNVLIIRMVLLLSIYLLNYVSDSVLVTLIDIGILDIREILNEILRYLFPLTWLVFFDYSVYKSKSRIYDKYRFSMLPIGLLAVFWAVIQYVNGLETIDGVYINEGIPLYVRLTVIYRIMAFIICQGYILYAFLIVRTYYKEMKQPLFIRFDSYFVPWIIGIIITVLTGINVEPMFSSFAILLTFITIKNRYQYLDSETEFYNTKFIPFISRYFSKKDYKGGCVIHFEAQDNMALGRVLLKYMIPKSVVINVKDNGYLMIADTQDLRAIQLCESLIMDGAKEESTNISVKVSNWIRNSSETILEFTDRVLKEIGG